MKWFQPLGGWGRRVWTLRSSLTAKEFWGQSGLMKPPCPNINKEISIKWCLESPCSFRRDLISSIFTPSTSGYCCGVKGIYLLSSISPFLITRKISTCDLIRCLILLHSFSLIKQMELLKLQMPLFLWWMSRQYYGVVGIFDWEKIKSTTKEHVKLYVCGNLKV